jgi:predicted TIM-barrel fold metal-dependent hydrolase
LIIDFHTHIVHPEVRKNREKYFSDEPGFKLLYESPKLKLAGAEDIVAVMNEHGIDRSVVFGFPWKNIETAKKNNDYIIESVNRHPDRLTGFCCVDPSNKDASKEVERCLESGLSGVGELAFYSLGIGQKTLEKLAPIMEICREKDMAVLIHTNEPVGHVYPGKAPIRLSQIYKLVKRFNENKIVLGHWGGGIFFFNLLKREVKESLRNVYFDTAASPFLYEPKIYKYGIELAGINKILFGTDYPLLAPARYFKEMSSAGLSENEIAAICGENAKKLLGI